MGVGKQTFKNEKDKIAMIKEIIIHILKEKNVLNIVYYISKDQRRCEIRNLAWQDRI